MEEIINVQIPNTTIGLGALKNIAVEVLKFNPQKILLITDESISKVGITEIVTKALAKTNIPCDIFDKCQPEPSIKLIEEIIEIIRNESYDLLIGLGGGSNMDATKIASIMAHSDTNLRDFLSDPYGARITGKTVPKFLLPTTAGTGAEWSMAVVIYDETGFGHPIGNEKVYPDKVIIDPEFCINLPAHITAETGFDALTHAIEAYVCSDANFFSDMFASTAIKLVSENLRPAYAKGYKNKSARYNMSLAAAIAMNSAIVGGMGLCHFIAEYVQRKAHISHGASLAIMLPSVMNHNLIGNIDKYTKIAELMNENISGLSPFDAASKSINAVNRLISDLNLPKSMREVGIQESNIEQMAKEAYKTCLFGVQRWNPRHVTEVEVIQIFNNAF